MFRFMSVSVCGLLISAAPCLAESINVPQDFATIQQAINAAQTSDVIVVSPGTYTENIHFLGKAITVTGTDPLDETVVSATRILGVNGTAVVTFAGTEKEQTALEGLWISGGQGSSGKGINCQNASPSISRCLIDGNDSSGVYLCDGSISHCKASFNGGGLFGGGFYLCDGTITDCVSERNGGNGFASCDAHIDRCISRLNVWDGFRSCDGIVSNTISSLNGAEGFDLCDGTIQNCTIVANDSSGLRDCDGTIKSVISWDNGIDLNDNIELSSLPSFSIFKTDPMFVDPPNDNRLMEDSPALNTGDPQLIPGEGETDFDGNARVFAGVVDIGAYEAPSMDCDSDFDGDSEADCIDFDIDSDGIRNGADQCDYTPLGAPIDAAGRPLGDVDRDCDTDLQDFALFQLGITGPQP